MASIEKRGENSYRLTVSCGYKIKEVSMCNEIPKFKGGL